MKVCTTCGVEYPEDQSFCPADGSALRSTSSTDLVGSIVAERYRIVKKLGEGGMGAVYLGEHVKMGRMCAVKVISKSLAQDSDAIARFNREAANAARINHPNVCSIYDFGETDDGVIYLAMEFIEGEALTDLVNREGALSPKRAAEIARQTAEALEAAHEFGIVHRDLKPDNIMIAKNRDGSDLAKVVDFGIAKAAGGDEKQNVTKTGLVVGTPEYMSPEQLSGDTLDGRSDIYSLALVFFRMLTGTLPFQADTAQEVMIKRLTDEPLTLAEAVPETDFPAALQQVMDHALQRMPSERYASAHQFGADVVKAVTGMADVAAAVDTEGATQLMDSSDITAQAEALDGATEAMPQTRLSGAASAPTPDTPIPPTAASATPYEEPGKREETKKKTPMVAIAAVVGVLVVGGGSFVVMTRGSSDAAAVDSTGQIAQNGVTPDTETPSDSGNAGRQGADNTQDDRRQTQTDTDPPPDSGQMVATEDTTTTLPVVTNPAWMDVAAADDHLVILLLEVDSTSTTQELEAIRDTSIIYFNAIGISDADQGTAAYVAALALQALGNKQTALNWVRRALQIKPGDNSAQLLLEALERGGNP